MAYENIHYPGLSPVSISIPAQQTKYSYLVVTLSTAEAIYLHHFPKYTRIHAEPGNSEAKRIYDLVDYKRGKTTLKTFAGFYSENKDSSVLYNYFLNTSAALNFMSSTGWELISVNVEMASEADFATKPYDYDSKREFAHTKLSSKTFYYMRKVITPASQE